MPTYQYACTECAHSFEQFQAFSDAALTECPTCGGRLRKVWGSVGIVFKGSGFYRNDSREAASKGGTDKETGGKGSKDKEPSGTPGQAGASGADRSAGHPDGGSTTKPGSGSSGSGSSGSGSSGSGSSGSGSSGSGSSGSGSSGSGSSGSGSPRRGSSSTTGSAA